MTSVRVESIFQNAKASRDTLVPLNNLELSKIVSDASGFKAAIINLDSSEEEWLEFAFSDEEKSLSSGARELLAVQKTVSHWFSTKTMSKKLVYWATDSTHVVSFLEKGSSKPHIQSMVLDIAIKLAKLGSWIQPIHLFREDERIKAADELSKNADSDDWSIDEINFSQLKNEFDLSVDMFASALNARLPRFFGKFYEEGSSGVDAFSVRWEHGMWICPPVHLLPRIANEIRSRRNCSGIIACPDWPTAAFYGKFFDGCNVRNPFRLEKKIDPFIFQNQDAKGPLCGKVTFKFCILSFFKS